MDYLPFTQDVPLLSLTYAIVFKNLSSGQQVSADNSLLLSDDLHH